VNFPVSVCDVEAAGIAHIYLIAFSAISHTRETATSVLKRSCGQSFWQWHAGTMPAFLAGAGRGRGPASP
jgi:hypothetical protein